MSLHFSTTASISDCPLSERGMFLLIVKGTHTENVPKQTHGTRNSTFTPMWAFEQNMLPIYNWNETPILANIMENKQLMITNQLCFQSTIDARIVGDQKLCVDKTTSCLYVAFMCENWKSLWYH